MRLRAQLGAVSLVTLLLPWAGFNYVATMEQALREGQQDMQAKFAGSVAAYIEGQDYLVDELRAALPIPGADSIYLHTQSARALTMDGREDEDLDLTVIPHDRASAEANNDSDTFHIYLTAILGQVYMSIKVQDADRQLRDPLKNNLNSADYFKLVMGHADSLRSLIFAPETAGLCEPFPALREQNGRLITQYSSTAIWCNYEDRYTAELSFPEDWLGEYFGVLVHDGKTGNQISSLNELGEPGKLIRSSELLEGALRHFSSKIDLVVLDANKWVRSRKGGSNAEQLIERKPGTWLLEWLYRQISPGSENKTIYQKERAGRLMRPEIDQAMMSEAGGYSNWYQLSGDQISSLGTTVLSTAIRISDKESKPVGTVVLESSSAGVLMQTNQTLVSFAQTTTLIITSIFAVLLIYATWLSVRIRRLSNQVMTVMEAQGEELHEFPEQTAGDEIGAMGRNFGRLLGRVRGYTDYLKSLGSKLSHELHTPLQVVRTSLENLQDEELSPDARRFLERAQKGSDRLSHILISISEARSVEDSIQSAVKENIDLVDLVNQIVTGYKTAYPDRNIELQLPDEKLAASLCPELVAQMLDKLMDNACDFCPDDGAICFSVQRDDSDALLIVENDGPQLPEDIKTEQLFEPMVSQRATMGDRVHMGQGLTIVRLVSDFHGGAVSANNCEDRSGVRFAITLPLIS